MRKIKLLFIFIFVISCVKTIDNNKDKKYIEKTNTDLYYYNKCLEFLKSEEGLKLKPYRCTSKKMTIGYGHRILKEERKKFRKGITQKIADSLLIADFNKAIEDVKSSKMVNSDDNKYIYLYAILCFQTGKRGFEEFDDFIASVEHSKDNDNPDAKVGIYYALKDSKLNKQAPNRVDRYINLIVQN